MFGGVFFCFACHGVNTPHEDEANDSTSIDTAHEYPTPLELIPETDFNDQLCSKRYGIEQNGIWQYIPYCANFDISSAGSYPQVERLIFSIHSFDRPSAMYYQRMEQAAELHGHEEQTMIISPFFPSEEHLSIYHLDETHAYWGGGWPAGSVSSSSDEHPRPFVISSYAFLDQMVLDILQNIHLPNLQKIIFIGHSAGGQLVNRYAAGSKVDIQSPPIQYMVANPSSYVYLSSKRWNQDAAYTFSEPDQATIDTCSEYNEWRYGLDDLYSYMSSTGMQTLRENYHKRSVVVLIGGEDNDPDDSSLATGCAAMLQGSQRLERSYVYARHLEDEFGQNPHAFALLEGVGHSSRQVFLSQCGQLFLFDVPSTIPCDLSAYPH